MKKIFFLISTFYCLHVINGQSQVFSYEDVYDIQYVSDPQIIPSGNQIVYRRMRYDILKDRKVGNLWVINSDGSKHQKLTSKEVEEYGAKWSHLEIDLLLLARLMKALKSIFIGKIRVRLGKYLN